MIPPSSVAGRLEAAVAARKLVPDAAQGAAAVRLDALRESLEQRSANKHRLRSAMAWLSGETHEAARGVYLWGGVGRGKTLLMDLFVDSLPAAAAPERSHFYHFMRDVHVDLGRIQHRASPLDVVAQRIAARTRIVCLDEFFVADIADAMILAGLLGGLLRRGVTLVMTSNLRPRDLYKDGLQRQRFLPAIALIEANVDVLHLDGGIDYRLRHLEQAPIYLDSTLPGSADLMRNRFLQLTGNDGECAKLTVEGHTLEAVRCSHGVVWFDFRVLCGGPRSQNDYIELARRFHTVFVSDVPQLGGTDDDAARRFIMMIDEFYDRGVKIVVSAAARPEALYRGERLRFEFERAASRLIEMQTQHYLAGQHRP